MKIRRVVLFALILSVLLSACGRGNIRQVEYDIGATAYYSSREVTDAMDTVCDYFEREFDGCKLLTVSYDEEFSQRRASDWAKQYDADQAIVLLSSFYVDGSGGDGSLNPNSTYDRYQWILTRNRNGSWKLQTWGYG